jgi:hypothetical protein
MATCFAPHLPKTTLYREFLTLDNPSCQVGILVRIGEERWRRMDIDELDFGILEALGE